MLDTVIKSYMIELEKKPLQISFSLNDLSI